MKRKHRIIVVATIFATVAAGGGAAVLVRQQILNKRALENRELGMVAIGHENYGDALHHLGRYIQRYGQEQDPEALFEYGRSRKNVPLPNNKHIGQAIGFFLQVLAIEPGHRGAQLELLELYTLVGYGQETLDLAQKVLDVEPESIEALRAQARALARLRKFDEALEPARKIVEIAPAGTGDHLLVLALMEGASLPEADMMAYPDTQPALNPEQAPYHLVRAAASELAGQRDTAIEAAKRASELVQPGSEDVILVNEVLTRFGLFDESMSLLARTAPESNDPDLLQFYCRRLFEIGNTAEVLRLTDGGDGATQPTGLLAVRAMAAGREGKKEVLAEVTTALAGKTDDALAKAWIDVLDVVWVRENASPQEVLAACNRALENDQANPYFHYFSGLAHERTGERDNALLSLQKAVQISPAWIDPILRSASLLASGGGHAEAFSLVRAAIQRAPQNPGVAAAGAEIIGASLESLSEENLAQLLKLCEQVQSVQPLEPRTLPLMIHLQARKGDLAAATALAQSALQGDAPLPEATLLRLAQLSDQHGLGVSEACYARLNGTTGATPGAAFAQATSLLRKGDAAAARTLLDEAAAKAGGGVQWQTAQAQFLEMTGSDEALGLWTAIAEQAGEDPGLLRMILDSRAAWGDLALIDRVIERLKSATGENAVNWRVARARWMLLSDTSQKTAAEAAALLNETMRVGVPEAPRYALLATALERLNNMQGAVESLEQAVQIAPNAPALRFELARVQATRGDMEAALAQVEGALQSNNLTDEDRRKAAALLVRGNQVARAIEVLEVLYPDRATSAPLDLQLAQLYRRTGDLARAEAIAKRFLAERPDEFSVAFAADLIAVLGRKEEAVSVLAGLDALDLPPGRRPLIRAEYHRVHGPAEAAATNYEQALAEAPADPAIWKRHLAFLARGEEPAAAIRRIAEAAVACPEEAAFKELSAQAPRMEKLLENGVARPFIIASLENPAQMSDAVQILEAIEKNPEDLATIALDLRRIADQLPGYLTAQTQLVRLYSALNRHGEAAEIATRAMRNFSEEIEPAVLAAQACASAGQWTEALSAAQEWRRRAPNGPQGADFMIADAQIKLGQSSEALETIQAYAEQAGDNPMVLSRQAQALIVGGRADEAGALLRPHLAEPGFRMAWVELATLVLSDEAQATQWLDEAAGVIPEESLDERGALALAWYQLSERFKSTDYRDKSRVILEELALRPDVTADLLFRLGMVYDVSGVHELAEANYRRAIDLAPELIAAKNNLAMRYISSNKNLDEALKLAQEAAASAPNSANIQDTLAQAQAAVGDYGAAISSLQRAAELEPENREWTDRLELLKTKQSEASPGEQRAQS